MKFRSKYQIVLASQSPRRQNLLKEIIPEFEIRLKEIEEDFDPGIEAKEVAPFLAVLKSKAYKGDIRENELLITADTTVILDNKVINKPENRQDAIRMISELSGRKHTVVSGVCMATTERSITFSTHTDVYFKDLTKGEIEYYVDRFEPYDKAGAYGIQEWIGYIGIEKIDGCYYNVMGLPLQRLYAELQNF